jgi:hypothetical protein
MSCPSGCGRSVQPKNFMCWTCWHLLPEHLKKGWWTTRRQLDNARDKGFDHRTVATLEREHREACDDAVAYVKARIKQKELFA